jgi:hypothetical protein
MVLKTTVPIRFQILLPDNESGPVEGHMANLPHQPEPVTYRF